MKIVIDGKDDILSHSEKDDNLWEIIEGIKEFANDNNRVILSIKADNKDLTTKEPTKAFKKKTVAGVKKLTLKTAPKKQMSNFTLGTVKKSLPKFKKNFEKVAQLVTERKNKTALETFIKLIDEWAILNETFINSLKLIRYDIRSDLGDGQSVKAFLDEYNELYKEVCGAFENQDWVLLADLLEYEIAPKTDAFSTLIDQVNEVTQQLVTG